MSEFVSCEDAPLMVGEGREPGPIIMWVTGKGRLIDWTVLAMQVTIACIDLLKGPNPSRPFTSGIILVAAL